METVSMLWCSLVHDWLCDKWHELGNGWMVCEACARLWHPSGRTMRGQKK